MIPELLTNMNPDPALPLIFLLGILGMIVIKMLWDEFNNN